MKRILCFGDSNTYGYNPARGRRFDEEDRWPLILEKLLGSGYRVIEEGLCGRTTVWDSTVDKGRRGDTYLYPCLQSHSPLDLVIIMLGTNDCKARFSRDSIKITEGLQSLIKIVNDKELWGEKGFIPKLIIVSPVAITANVSANKELYAEFAYQSVEISGELAPLYQKLAQKHGAYFLNAENYASASPLDGIHLDKDGGINLAKALAELIQTTIYS